MPCCGQERIGSPSSDHKRLRAPEPELLHLRRLRPEQQVDWSSFVCLWPGLPVCASVSGSVARTIAARRGTWPGRGLAEVLQPALRLPRHISSLTHNTQADVSQRNSRPLPFSAIIFLRLTSTLKWEKCLWQMREATKAMDGRQLDEGKRQVPTTGFVCSPIRRELELIPHGTAGFTEPAGARTCSTDVDTVFASNTAATTECGVRL